MPSSSVQPIDVDVVNRNAAAIVSVDTPRTPGPNIDKIIHRVNATPPLKTTLFLGFQHVALTATSMVVYPMIVAEAACAGNYTTQLRMRLLASTYVATGLATLLQTTIGLRLPVLQGTAISFLPPILAWKQQNKCTFGPLDDVPSEFWMARLSILGGSLAVASILLIIIAATCLVGLMAKYIGPMTIFPVFLLLAMSTIETMDAKMKMHWIAWPAVGLFILFSTFLGHTDVALPDCQDNCTTCGWTRAKVFAMFPYLLVIGISWFLCALMTWIGMEKPGGAVRTDLTWQVLVNSTWFQAPYPGMFGSPQIDTGLLIGFIVCCVSVVVENVGTYEMAGRCCDEPKPPTIAVSRAIFVEGLGTGLAALMGVGVGVTAYAKNVALVRITGIASRVTVQVAGVILIAMGCFTKTAAFMSTIPDPLVGAILCMSMSIVVGVAISNLQQIDLSINRNVTIIGISIMLGTLIPYHAEKNPVDTGDKFFDNILNQLLCIKMLVGGVISLLLDNLVSGATRTQRGFRDSEAVVVQRRGKYNAYAMPKRLQTPIRVVRDWLSGRSNRRRLQNSYTDSVH